MRISSREVSAVMSFDHLSPCMRGGEEAFFLNFTHQVTPCCEAVPADIWLPILSVHLIELESIRQRKGWTVHSCPSQSPAESEKQAARNHEAKPWSQCRKGHAGNKGLHDRMAELLRDSVPKDENAGMGRMVAAPNPCIHLEAMEETKLRNLVKLGVPEYYAHMAANSRRGYWFTANTGTVTRRITNERLTRAGFFELSPAYESIQSACIGRAVYRTVRMVR